MSRHATTENNRSPRNTTNAQTFLSTCALDVDHKLLKEHLVSNPVQQSDLDKCLLRGLRIVQRKELSHVAQSLTILLQSGAKWNSDALLDDQITPYHIICASPGDHHELLDLIIKSSQKITIDTQDIYQRTALLQAVRHANINCLKCLISYGADVNIGYHRFHANAPARPHTQWTPIMEAIEKLRYAENTSAIEVDTFELLLDSGVDLNKPSYKCYLSPIKLAVKFGNVYCIKKLIMKGARFDTIGSYQRYVWPKIARLGHVKLLKCMLNHGLDKDSTDRNGYSVLRTVAKSGNVEAVRYLLDQCVAIPIYPPKESKRKYEQCTKHRLIIHIYDERAHQNPCMRAIRHNQLEIVKLFEERRSQCCNSFTALRHAVINNSVDVASYLLNKYTYPLNIEYIIDVGYSRFIVTLLTEPRSVFTAKITKLLLDHGADPAKQMPSVASHNATMTAIYYRNLRTIGQYIRSGVDINFRSYADIKSRIMLPFESSVLHGFHNVAEMLLTAGCSCGVFNIDNNHNFKDDIKPEVEKLMKKWKVQENNVIPLQQRCRNVILNHLSPRADKKIEMLPLPLCLIKFLSIPELDDIIDEYNKADRY